MAPRGDDLSGAVVVFGIVEENFWASGDLVLGAPFDSQSLFILTVVFLWMSLLGCGYE